MKIGILTQHFLLNYGGIIQNYALQQVLMKLGHEPLTLEHDTCYSRTRWFLRTIKHILRTRSFRNLPVFPIYKGRIGNKNFIKFVLKNIKSVPVTDFVPSLTAQYGIDAYVVGSDQVWRPAFNLGHRLGNMFLDFADDKVKKLSYAASFGCKEWEYTKEQEKACSKLARRFDAISVREASAVDLCKNHFGIDTSLVLDPTLLLNKEDYEKVCNNIPKKEKHIFVYSLVVGESVMTVASKVSEAKGLPIVVKEAGGKVKKEDTIEDWFAEFRDAEYVVTDSFHGMVFSIIFNKPFSIVMNPSGGNDRYISLLSQLGLMDRIIKDNQISSLESINWDGVNKKLEVLRHESMNFLKVNFNQTHEE